MGRTAGSKNRVSFPHAPQNTAVAEPVIQVQSQTPTQTANSNEIKRTYREGAAVIDIPKSNSTAALFPESMPIPEPTPPQEPAQDNVPRGTNEDQQVPTPEPTQEPEDQPEPTVEPQKDQNLEPKTDEVVYLEDLLKKMNIDPAKVKTKTKVDGVENDVSILDVKKSYQLEQHLTKRGQKIGEERKQLEALRQELARSKQEPQITSSEPSGDPVIDSLRQELEQIRAILPSIQPVIYQTARQQLANELKDQGYPDFMDYVDKIDARVGAEPDDNKWRYYNTKEGAKQLYFQMKLEDQIKGTPTKQAEPAKPQPRPPVIKIDGGAQPSKTVVDDATTKYNNLVTEWKKNPAKNKHLLPEILKMKGALFIQ